MHRLLRRLRGLLGLGVFTGAAWAFVGLVIGTVVLLVDPAVVGEGEGPGWIAFYFGRSGLVAGLVAGLVLAATEGHRSGARLRLSRMALWGALGGLSIPWLAAGPQAMLPFFVVLGAGTGGVTWALARRGERLEVGAPDDRPPELHAGTG